MTSSQHTEPIVDLSAWRERRRVREQGIPVQLSSGLVARLRPVTFSGLLENGNIPDMLTPIVRDAVQRGQANVTIDNGQDFANFMQLMNLVCKAAFVCPRIVDDPEGDDEISLADLEMQDRQEVFSLMEKPAHALRSFRPKQNANVEFVPDSENAVLQAE